ncbi:Kiwa anti-phage protein KwaB-like domain-containing protein [Pectobacterium carotovorum]|uniref:Kiwa anti-phage protein KwaB-like domain-containing protein n=1 Tax=Pectobacterium carotovorum TaxID=554 RepID=UPI003019B260
MTLFALMSKNSAVKVYRVETDKKTDNEITVNFQTQLQHFESHHNTELPYEPGYNPSYNECSYIKKFTDSAILLDAVNRSTAMPLWNEKIGLDEITAFFMAPDYPNNKTTIAIQSFSKKQILNASQYLWLNKGVFSTSQLLGFSLDDKLTAIINNDVIKFLNFNNLRSIFDMSVYFALATKNDIDIFVKQSVFDLPQGFDLNNIADNVIRKKITLINKSGILVSHTVADIKTAASKLNFTINTSGSGSNEKIIIPTSKKEIKELLNFLDEDYFNSEITKQRFRSNSKRKA